MKMAAVVELAVPRMGFDVRHQTRQVHRVDVIETKFLESGGVNHRSGFCIIHPIQARAGGRVFARVQGCRNLVRQYVSVRQQPVDKRAFTRT